MNKIIILLACVFLLGCKTNQLNKTNIPFSKYSYELDLANYQNDQVQVKLSIDPLQERSTTFCFPKIVPGIYGAMDFGQYINTITVKNRNGKEMETNRIDQNCWEINNANQIATIEYMVDDTWEEFDFEMKRGFYKSAASTFQEDVFLINPNCLFGYFRGLDHFPIELAINKATPFYGATSLEKISSTATQDKYLVSDYHQLVDNPILYAAPDTALIQLDNIDVEVACYSSSKQLIAREIANYIKPLLINQTKYLGGKLPVEKYTFMLFHNLNPDPNSYMADGLEHSHSTIILFYMPLDLEIIRENVYGIASHEFFHTLMPLGIHSHEIANYDFNEPQFSRHLWLYEGMTEYFTIHMPIKNGVQELSEFLQVLERKLKQMEEFDNNLSFTDLSLNAMEKQDQYYNVYLKGALLNLCLDVKLRELSNGSYGTQNLVMDLIDRYGIHKSFDDEKLFDEIVELTGFPELSDFFKKYIIGTEKLPLVNTLEKVGLQLNKGAITIMDQLSDEQRALRKQWIDQ